MLIAIALATLVEAAPGSYSSLTAATAAIANGEDTEAAVARVRAAGKPGLWALHDAAKQKSGVERGRLFEAIGRFGGPDAEWALIVELKSGSDSEGRAGAIRGLVQLKSSKTNAAIIRAADTADDVVRGAVVEALAAIGGGSEAQLRSLLESESEYAREAGLRYLARAGAGPVVAAAIAPALADRAARVRRQGIALAARAKDHAHVFTLAEMARHEDEELGVEAVRALGEIGGWSAPSELGTIVADPATKEGVRRLAAERLRALGRQGIDVLVHAIARSTGEERVRELERVAAEKIGVEELEAVVDLLDDAACAKVSRAILELSGEAGVQAATKRLSTALPELQDAIGAYLKSRAALAPRASGTALEISAK